MSISKNLETAVKIGSLAGAFSLAVAVAFASATQAMACGGGGGGGHPTPATISQPTPKQIPDNIRKLISDAKWKLKKMAAEKHLGENPFSVRDDIRAQDQLNEITHMLKEIDDAGYHDTPEVRQLDDLAGEAILGTERNAHPIAMPFLGLPK
jgi:hypothetical protein